MNENKFRKLGSARTRSRSVRAPYVAASLLAVLLAGCVPCIEVAVPTTPITININVRVEHDITIRADKDATRLLESGNNAAEAVSESESRVETTTREQTRAQTVVTPAAAVQGR